MADYAHKDMKKGTKKSLVSVSSSDFQFSLSGVYPLVSLLSYNSSRISYYAVSNLSGSLSSSGCYSSQ